MDEIEDGRRARDVGERLRVAGDRLVEVRPISTGIAWICAGQGCAPAEQVRAQVRQIPIRVIRGGDPLVHLQHVDAHPRQVQRRSARAASATPFGRR